MFGERARALGCGWLGLVAAIVACQPTPSTSRASLAPEIRGPASLVAPPRVPTVAIRYRRIEPDRWRADYTFSQPLSVVTFRTANYRFRDEWKVLTDGARLVRGKDGDILLSQIPFSTLSIDIPYTDKQPDKGYRAFYPYTDDGLLAYTGHVTLALATCGGEGVCQDPSTIVRGTEIDGPVSLEGLPGESILVRGQPRGPVVTIPGRGEGTYAYFGSLPSLETGDFVGVVDRGFPDWIRTRLDALLPPLFAHFADSLGRPPPTTPKPTLFATFAKLSGSARDLGGGVTPRVVNFNIGLGPTATPDATLRTEIEIMFAHEIAHLWNSDLFDHDGGPETAWLHEGGADALAYRALRAQRVLDEAAYRARLSNALSLCVLSLSDGQPLSASTAAGHVRAFYDCGSTIALLTEGAVAKRDPNKNLASFWRAMFEASKDRRYDEALYYATLDQLADPATTAFVRRLTRERLDDPATEIAASLTRAGIATKVVGTPSLPLDYETRAGPQALRSLAASACADALELDGDNGIYPRITKAAACGTAAARDVIESLSGFDIAKKGATAHDAGYARCQRDRTITLGLRGKSPVTIPCAPAPRPRPPYLAVTTAP